MLKFFRKNHKKILIFTLLVSICFAVFFVFHSSTTLASSYGEEKLDNINIPKIESSMLIVRIINWALGFLGLIAVIIVLYAGFLWMTAGGKKDRVEKAKKYLINGLIGLTIILLAEAITLYVFYILGQKLSEASGGSGGGGNNGGGGGGTPIELPVNRFRINAIITDCSDPATSNEDVYLCSAIVVNFNNFLDKDTVSAAIDADQLKIEECSDSNCSTVQVPDFYPATYSTQASASGSSWYVQGRSLVFHHQKLFKKTQTYRLVIPKSLRDQSGLLLDTDAGCGAGLGSPVVGCTNSGTNYNWVFTTGETVDTTKPTIVSSYPANSTASNYPDRKVNMRPVLRINFSEPVDPVSIDRNNIRINLVTGTVNENGSGGILGYTLSNYDVSLNSDGKSVDIYNLNLEKFSWYEITVSNIKDLCNNPLAQAVSWRFETTDVTPGVSYFYPTDGYSDSCPNTPVYVVFNTSMYDPVTESCQVTSNGQGGGLVTSGSLTPDTHGRILQVVDNYDRTISSNPNNYCKHYEFLPTTNLLAENTTYTVNIQTNMVLNANNDRLSVAWQFSTKSATQCTNQTINCGTDVNTCALNSNLCPSNYTCRVSGSSCQCSYSGNNNGGGGGGGGGGNGGVIPPTNNQLCGEFNNNICTNADDTQCTDPNYPVCNTNICKCVIRTPQTNNQVCGQVQNNICNLPDNALCSDPNYPVCDPTYCHCVKQAAVVQPLRILLVNPTTNNQVCQNIVGQVVFNQLVGSNYSNNILIYEEGGTVTNNTTSVSFISNTLTNNTTANINGQNVTCTNPDGCTIVKLLPNQALKQGVTYRWQIKGGPTGIKGINGSTLATDVNYSFSVATTAVYCQINSVKILPNPYTFNRAGENAVFVASAITTGNIELSPVSGVYDWSWTWTKVDQDNIINFTNSSSASQTVTANNVNGEAVLMAQAKISTDIIRHTENKTYLGRTNITNFLCLNPWPATTDTYADTGAYANFSLYYCRDKGDSGIDDDLPALRVPVISTNTGSGVLKEYLFLRDDDSTDAIGLRIFSNPDFLSPQSWYTSQNFISKSSPQTITVDGYAAIRDGRSVYVAAANLSGNTLYPNIYLLSYNENASNETMEIYNQLLKNWIFNINPEITDYKVCNDNATYCTKDSDCPNSGTCDALKTKLIRDTQRITDLGAFRRNLNIAFEKSNLEDASKRTYPMLKAGSYEIGHSTSLWPSWTTSLASLLGATPPTDPLNSFNLPCSSNTTINANYDQASCWNELTKSYLCPAGSHLYEYSVNSDGTNFQIYANMEYEGPGRWINGSYGTCANYQMSK